MNRMRQRRVIPLAILLSLLVGCSLQAPYMRGWDLAEHVTNRWTGGTLNEAKLSSDEAAVYRELGTPDAVRFFRAVETRQRVYEWIYLQRDQTVWFLEGQRVDYVAVDANSSGLTKETRETLEDKATKGGVLGAVVGGIAAGLLILGDNIGLKD